MSALIAASAIRTCFGDGAQTFAALLRGDSGVVPLRQGETAKLNVSCAHHAGTDDPHRPFRAGEFLAQCLADVAREAAVDTSRMRVVVLIGTGLRELSAVERWALTGAGFDVEQLHFGEVVRQALPGVAEVITISNACSASGHALALAQDLVEFGEADVVLACGADTMTQSMLAMIGRVAPEPTTQVRPFDRDRDGVLLGEGAAAVAVVGPSWTGPALGRLAATGLSCDAHHETAPDIEGISRSMRDAFDRAGREPAAVDLVVAHGTGTALNDSAESQALRKVLLSAGGDPLVTAVKGSTGHTSGSASLVNLDVALRCLAGGQVPPITGLRTVLPEADGLRFAVGEPVPLRPGLVQVNAFGFGGVNAVTLLEAV
ncbi:MAG TPA: beta-ketoacyl synthase N-terminal-like domain-containing protein [Jatrophihabitans sp.]|jgi:3-oxoacyl-[acyl-carrier-protein] synthase II|uniref:beta-ketoacyl synthase N-terminal-like domain-containing protein n=1 Tax=Jatrophihabitans sp. TaxID=1932789 RepID=UPI002F24F250